MSDIASLDRDIDLIIEGAYSPRAVSRVVAELAREALAEGEAHNRAALGRVPAHTVTVDGVLDAPLERVRPDGEIVFRFAVGGDVVAEILAALREASPVLTGGYRAAHIILADGNPVSGDDLPAASVYQIVNTAPYARKIERGLSPQAPEGVYEAVAAVMAQRFGNQAAISFAYRAPLTAYLSRGSASPAARRAERAARAPAITIRML